MKELYQKFFKGKIINCMGDSITFGVNGLPEPHHVSNPYPKIMAETLKCVVNNYGISRSTIGGDGVTINHINKGTIGYFPMWKRIKEMDKNADYNIVFGGTNDYGNKEYTIPLGTIDDDNPMTFYGALKEVAKYLLETYPNSKNAFIIPLQRSETDKNVYGNTFVEYVNAVKEVASMYGIPYLDLYSTSGSPKSLKWKETNMYDGLHPNEKYYYVLADRFIRFLMTI